MISKKEILKKFNIENRSIPLHIEDVANCIGHGPYLDKNNQWLKNPIKPESCNESDWRYIDE